jgi:hypothetical protein
VEGWVEIAFAIIRKKLTDPVNLQYWRDTTRPIVQKQFENWCESGEPVAISSGISSLVMTAVLHMLTGPEFAEKHAAELVPFVEAIVPTLASPMVRLFPHWVSKEGRLLKKIDERYKELVDEEVVRRLENMDKYRDQRDYLQMVLNEVGRNYAVGLSLKVTNLSVSGSRSSYNGGCTWQPADDLRLVTPPCYKVSRGLFVDCPSAAKLTRSPSSRVPRNRSSLH